MKDFEKDFVPYSVAVRMKELGFDEPCMYAYCITPKHRVEYKGEKCLRTDGNPFGEFFSGKNWNLSYGSNKNKIQCSAPTFSQCFRWFREKHALISSIYQLHVNIENGMSDFEYMIDKLNNLGLSKFIEDFPFKTYEKAELACLEKLIEIIELKQKEDE